MPKNNTDKFLKAIKKYAKAQKNALKGEVIQLKTERLKEAEAKAKRDSQRLLKDGLREKTNKSTALLAKETQESRKKLFLERAAMTEEIFSKAEEKLIAFTETGEYPDKLKKSAEAIHGLFGEESCTLYICERDLSYSEELKSIFGGNAEIEADKKIKIGGVRGFCESRGIIADETLDSKLNAQHGWFTENCTLSVE